MLKRIGVAACLVVSVVLLVSCSDSGRTGPATDAQLRQDIAAKLEAANIPKVVVSVQAGAVTLTGEVLDQATADRAVELARATEGVQSVDSQISVPAPQVVLPQNPEEALLTGRVNQRLASDPALAGSKISPSVAGGVATLTGTVPSDAAKAAAEQAARSVQGVTSVVNNLQVVATQVETNVPDDKIADAVTELLDRQFSDYIVNVDVKNGVVALSGAVPNRSVILQITNSARQIKGVKAVDTSRLTVQGGEPDNERIGAPAGPS